MPIIQRGHQGYDWDAMPANFAWGIAVVNLFALPGQYQAGLAAAEGRVGLEFNKIVVA